MDARGPPTSPGSAVSGLMQQLKNGEISKMQLFQQIAKLQAGTAPAVNGQALHTTVAAASAAAPPPAPSVAGTNLRANPTSSQSMAPGSAASLVFGGATHTAAPPQSSAPFVTFNYSPPRAPMPAAPSYQDTRLSSTHTSASTTTAIPPARIGAQPLPSDADVLSAGVSHDKAQRLSVQEWMASKSRAAASAPTGSSAQPTAPSTSSFAPLLLTGGQVHPASQLASASTAATPSVLTAGPSLFSFLNPQQSETNDIRPAARSSLTTGPQDSSGSSWNQQPHQAEDSYDERHEHDNANGGSGLLSGNGYLHFDPFRDDPHNHDEGPGTTGKGKGTRNGDEAKFHTRVTRWKSQKDAVREQMKQQLLQSELDECTFAPKVNPKSTKVVAKLRGRQRSVGETDAPGGGLSGAGSSGGIAVSERLYQEADNYKAREELAARLKAEEEAELERECTFRPKINKNNPLTEKVKPKYMEIPKRDAPMITPAALEAAAKELEQCTFVPQVNAVSQEMVSAQLYLQQNIYDRLSRPCVGVHDADNGDEYRGGRADDDNGDYIDDIECLGSPRLRTQDDIFIRSRRRRGSAGPGQHPRSTQRPRSAGGIVTDAEKAERARQFEAFLERQKFHEQARKKKLQVTQQQLVQAHKPSINKKSSMMMENGRKGDFLERISQYAIRKEQDTVKNKTVRVSDPHCTFKPAINPHSAKRSARSVTELSRGDLLRRETTQRLMKLKMEQEEMASLTFRPELSRASQRVEGRLKILTSPDTYLQRIQQQSQAHMMKQRRAIQEKETEEFSECTFKPRTIEAPAYVQRIARSVVLTKALKKQQEATVKANQKPEWK